MKWLYVYRAAVVLALLVLGGLEWRNCGDLQRLQDQQRNLLKPVGSR